MIFVLYDDSGNKGGWRHFNKVKYFKQVWVGDVTYVRTSEGWLYLAIVLDVWSLRIVGLGHGARHRNRAFDE